MKAIYIAYSKCGTKTMNVVFKTLGYKCYDVDDNYFYLYNEWMKIMQHGSTKEDFLKMYSDVDAAVDHPIYHYWEEILEAFPDVKLLVSYRDEESWKKSFIKQMKEMQNPSFQLLTMLSPSAQRFIRAGRMHCYKMWGMDKHAWPWQVATDCNIELVLKNYRKHNLYIQQKAPKKQLHVVDFSAGWGPICEFLGEPVPDVPFPHANKAGAAVKDLMEKSPVFATMKREMLISVTIIIVFVACLLFYFYTLIF